MPEAVLINGEILVVKTPEDIFSETREVIMRARNWYLDAVYMGYSAEEVESRKQRYLQLVADRDAELLNYTATTGKGGFVFSKS